MTRNSISVKEFKIMAHALGGTDPDKWYRNYFITDENCDNYRDLCELEKNGQVERVQTPSFCNSADIVFRVTDKGKNNFR